MIRRLNNHTISGWKEPQKTVKSDPPCLGGCPTVDHTGRHPDDTWISP